MAGIFFGAAVEVHPALESVGHCMPRAGLLRLDMAAKISIERCVSVDQPGWLELRLLLWPDANRDDHCGYMAVALSQPDRYLQLMAYDEQRQPVGFIEGSIRSDYVNGTESSPVGFVEGVYVTPAWRRQGVARRLFAAIGDWARARGCRELASDALLDNEVSQRAHLSLGFRETERVLYFTKAL
jgi:aminoglycoside 6'-N-acetyltransferase I